MKLLIEEFFGKLYEFIHSIDLFLMRLIIKIIFYSLIIGIIVFFVFLYLIGRGRILVYLLGIYIIAEIAHLIRKSM